MEQAREDSTTGYLSLSPKDGSKLEYLIESDGVPPVIPRYADEPRPLRNQKRAPKDPPGRDRAAELGHAGHQETIRSSTFSTQHVGTTTSRSLDPSDAIRDRRKLSEVKLSSYPASNPAKCSGSIITFENGYKRCKDVFILYLIVCAHQEFFFSRHFSVLSWLLRNKLYL
jgi:hypothetical protein